MKSQSLVPVLLVIALGVFAVSCGAPANPANGESNIAGTYDDLVAELRARGFDVSILDPLVQPFFTPEGRVLDLDGNQVQVFEYPNEEDALAEAESISPDGSSIGTSMVMWVEAPHFFRSGSLIVLYVGEDANVLEVLELILGSQVAGR